MKLNKKRKTLFVAVLMFLFLSLLAGCGGKKTEEADTERPEYIYVPEYFNLGNSDYIGSAINYENEIFYYTEAWDDETGKSRTGISKYNFESRKSEMISLDVGEASVSAMQITPDGKIALLLYEWTNTEDENGEYQDGSGSYALWYMDPETGWTKARRENGNPVIPTGIFEYFIRHHDPVIEGTALVAFAREGEKPMDWNSRELDVHIW